MRPVRRAVRRPGGERLVDREGLWWHECNDDQPAGSSSVSSPRVAVSSPLAPIAFDDVGSLTNYDQRMPPIDLRSDTVTRPSAAMRRAMAEAEVGDDVFLEDPTLNRLQERAAAVFGTRSGAVRAVRLDGQSRVRDGPDASRPGSHLRDQRPHLQLRDGRAFRPRRRAAAHRRRRRRRACRGTRSHQRFGRRCTTVRRRR